MISMVIIANSDWGDYALPYIASIRKYELDPEIILVDNGSKVPYPNSYEYELIRLEQTHEYNYMQALNTGINCALGDWLMIGNDDVLCRGMFVDTVKTLNPCVLYGLEVRHKPPEWGIKLDYIYGWLTIMHRSVYKRIGPYDEHYIGAGFDDIDYSWRAQKAGIPVAAVNLPFIHLADQPGNIHRRMEVKDYKKNSMRSMKYFMAKVRGKA